MNLLRAAALALAALFCMGEATPEPVLTRVDYVLTPVLENGALHALQVDLSFRAGAQTETRLALSDSWGGETELYRGVQGLEVVSGATMRDGEGPAARVLTHRPRARIHVRYRVVQDWEGAPRAEHGNPYRPIIQPGYFHVIGNTALAMPDVPLASPVRVRVQNLPRGWSFASDLERGGLNLASVAPSVMVGGDFRVLHGADPNVRVAIRGRWSFNDQDFVRDVNDVIAGQRRFWGDESTPFLVTVVQLDGPDNWTSIGGTGLGDAFAFFASPNADTAPIKRTLAHEGLHTWIPEQVGGAPEQDEALQYWFSEGFTEFYTGRVMVREGVWTPTAFAADFNRMLREYAESPVREAANARILADFWNDQPVRQLPYQRGRLLATMWDARLRAGGHDLDDIMLEMRARVHGGDPLKAVEMLPIVADAMGLDVRPDIARFAEQGAAIMLPEDVFAPCGRVTTRQTPRFHRGFDIEATSAHNNVIAGVDPASPAYAAGLRDGMVLVRRAHGEIGDAEQEIAYVVRDGGNERTISYMPRAPGPPMTVQSLVLDDDLAGDKLARCVAVLAGT